MVLHSSICGCICISFAYFLNIALVSQMMSYPWFSLSRIKRRLWLLNGRIPMSINRLSHLHLSTKQVLPELDLLVGPGRQLLGLFIRLPVRLSVLPSACPSVCQSVCLPVHLCVCLFVCLSVFVSVCLSVCACLFVCVCVCLQVLSPKAAQKQREPTTVHCARL